MKPGDKKNDSKSCLAKCLGDNESSEDVNQVHQVNVDGYSINETKNWARAANLGAVLVLTVCAFLYGYFA